MSHAVLRAFLGVGVLAPALFFGGCAKRVPLEGGKFEAQQKVVLTLKDGRTVSGRIAAGQQVSYRAGDAEYEAKVVSMTEDSIRLGGLLLINREGDYSQIASRLADSRVAIGPALPSVGFARTDVDKVDLIRFDTGRSVRSAGFWAYGGALLVMLFGERS